MTATGKRGHAAGGAQEELAAAADNADGLGAQQLDDLQQQRLLLAQPAQQRLQQPGGPPHGQRRAPDAEQPQPQDIHARPVQAQEHTEPAYGSPRYDNYCPLFFLLYLRTNKSALISFLIYLFDNCMRYQNNT